jgi:hypothetical protein
MDRQLAREARGDLLVIAQLVRDATPGKRGDGIVGQSQFVPDAELGVELVLGLPDGAGNSAKVVTFAITSVVIVVLLNLGGRGWCRLP